MAERATIAISVDPLQAVRIQQLMGDLPAALTTAQFRALNHTAGVGRTLIVRTIREELNVKAADIRGSAHRDGGVKVVRATRSKLRAEIRVSGARIPLIRFGARPQDPAAFAGQRAMAQRGVSWKIERVRGRNRDKQAFVARMPSGHVGVFKRRVGVARVHGNRPEPKRPPWFTGLDEKLTELHGPSVPQHAEHSQRLDEVLRTDLSAALAARLDHEINFALQRLTQGGK